MEHAGQDLENLSVVPALEPIYVLKLAHKDARRLSSSPFRAKSKAHMHEAAHTCAIVSDRL